MNAHSQVKRAFTSFRDGTFKAPPQFSSYETWSSIEAFHKVIVQLQPTQWERILESLGSPDEQLDNMDQDELALISTYRGGLADFGSP